MILHSTNNSNSHAVAFNVHFLFTTLVLTFILIQIASATSYGEEEPLANLRRNLIKYKIRLKQLSGDGHLLNSETIVSRVHNQNEVVKKIEKRLFDLNKFLNDLVNSTITSKSSNTNLTKTLSIDYIGYSNENVSLNVSHSRLGNETYSTNTAAATRRYWALILIFIPLCTIVGNVLVVASVVKEKNLHTVTNYFVVSLAIADLAVASTVMPFAVYYEVS